MQLEPAPPVLWLLDAPTLPSLIGVWVTAVISLPSYKSHKIMLQRETMQQMPPP